MLYDQRFLKGLEGDEAKVSMNVLSSTWEKFLNFDMMNNRFFLIGIHSMQYRSKDSILQVDAPPKPTIMEIVVKVKNCIEYSGLICISQHSRK